MEGCSLSPISTFTAPWSSLEWMLGCQPRDRGFKSRWGRHKLKKEVIVTKLVMPRGVRWYSADESLQRRVVH
jgi:hypothetical protein